MAISTQIIEESSRNIVVKYFITNNADYTEQTLFDASAFTDATRASLERIVFCLVGFSAQLDWSNLVGTVPIVSLASDQPHDLDFWEKGTYSGIPNNSSAGSSGDILISTSGLGAGDHGFIWLYLTK